MAYSKYSIIQGTDDSGAIIPIAVDSLANLAIDVKGPTSAYGEVLSLASTVTSQTHFSYNTINNQIAIPATYATGSVTASNGMVLCSTGAGAAGAGTLSSSKLLQCIYGYGGQCRFVAMFSAPATLSNQIAGLGNATDALCFGYNGTSFGILWRHAGTSVWIPQASWNIDPMLGSGPSKQTLVPTNLNVFQIRYQSAAGAIKFYIEDKSDGSLAPVHVIEYANANTSLSLSIPSFPFIFQAVNIGNTSNLTVSVAAFSMAVEGMPVYTGPKFSFDAFRSVNAGINNILSLQVGATFNGIPSRVQIKIRHVSLATDNNSSGICSLRIIKNGTPSSAFTFNPIDTNNSAVGTSTQSVTVSGGISLWTTVIALRDANQIVDLTDFDVYANAGDVLSFCATNTNTAIIAVAVNWSEGQ